jgi:predicted anti-sigma-YlaC factor YlaD
MTCDEARERIDGWLRGELSRADSAALETHAAGCAECQTDLDAVRLLGTPLRQLPGTIEPAADLWPGIERRLTPRVGLARRRLALPAWVLAAAAVVLIVVSATGTALLLRGRASAGTPARGIAALEAQYAVASNDLTAALMRARPNLAPGTAATIERSLAVIDSALAESRRALAHDPNNLVLEQLVVAAWRQKLDLLRRAGAIAKAS